jgi:hypothetical protein
MIGPAVGGLAVGALGLLVPGALGTGYGFVQAGLDRQALLDLPLWMVLVLPFAKIAATSISIGSGGSGGIFGPGMVIGGLLGAGIWRLLEPLAPAIPADPAPFVIVAMMALFGSIAHAPLAVMLMVAEMTGNLSMLAPAMVAVGLASFVVGQRSIYRSQLATRAESPAHRFRTAMPLLAAVPVGDAARRARLVISTTDLVASVAARMDALAVPGAPVVGRDGRVAGYLDREDLDPEPADATIAQATLRREPILAADDGLDEGLGALADHRRTWAPVASRGGQLAGILSVRDAIGAYRKALNGNVRQVRGLRGGGIIVEADLLPGSALRGRTVADIAWPKDTVLVSIERDGGTLVPRGALRLQDADRLSIFASPEARPELELLLATTVDLTTLPPAGAASSDGVES